MNSNSGILLSQSAGSLNSDCGSECTNCECTTDCGYGDED